MLKGMSNSRQLAMLVPNGRGGEKSVVDFQFTFRSEGKQILLPSRAPALRSKLCPTCRFIVWLSGCQGDLISCRSLAIAFSLLHCVVAQDS